MNISFSESAWNEYLSWAQTDKKIAKKINDLIKDIARSPHAGLGKPEPLKHALSGYWSRRITDEHRIVYRVESDTIKVIQVKYHY
jgi:toxin YoeB